MTGVIGFDTSCYRTSVACVQDGQMRAARSKLLEVPHGERGLQQSRGVFQHVQNLPVLMEEMFAQIGKCPIDAVAVSTRPRPVEKSYMPVFTVGAAAARSLAAALRVPLIETSHQQGHLRAALVDSALRRDEFLALHLSGGTTEIVRVHGALEVELLGGTSDISAGQLVDRAGVRMGLDFPAGPALEQMAVRGTARACLPLSMRDLEISYSGAETRLMRLIDAGEVSNDDLAAEVYSLLSRSIAKLIDLTARRTGIYHVLLAGGVASSDLFRRMLDERLKKRGCRARLYWARPELSGDNAVGVALIGSDYLSGRKGGAEGI